MSIKGKKINENFQVNRVIKSKETPPDHGKLELRHLHSLI